MTKGLVLLAIVGVSLLAVGAALSWSASRGYSEKQYLVDAGSCRMELTVVEKAGPPPSTADAVVLIHGLAANRKIMENLARTFAALGVRVFVPDLPGHGRSQGPFSPARAEECSLSLVRGLAARGMLDPAHTLLVGHSMGAAIALRIAPKFRPAGVIAISPAPMVAAHGVGPENLLYRDPPPLQTNTLILAGRFEPKGLLANAEDLAATRQDGTVRFAKMPWDSHVSVLFSAQVARECQLWAMRVFGRTEPAQVASNANLAGSLLGLLGIFLIAVPFLREIFGKESPEEKVPANLPSALRVGLEIALISVAVMFALNYWMPLRFIHLFEGDYLASFFLMAGALLLLLHRNLVNTGTRTIAATLLAVAIAGLVLHLLITGWFELTVTGSWLTAQRWLRLPVFCLAAFVFLFALEVILGPATESHTSRRVFLSFLYIAIAWSVLAVGVFHLHTGQIMLVLLIPFFALFFLFIRLGMQFVRRLTASPAAAALFGAILLAGLCLVLFPVS